MPQNLLQGKNVPAVHHEMRRERVAQHVRTLTLGQLNPGMLHRNPKRPAALGEPVMFFQVSRQTLLESRSNRDHTNTFRLGIGEGHRSIAHPIQRQPLRLRPARPRCQAHLSHQPDALRPTSIERFDQLRDLFHRQIR
ncbi:hypothetical protein D9M70_599910 [compost metagenome]